MKILGFIFFLTTIAINDVSSQKEYVMQNELQAIDQVIAKVFEAICFEKGDRPNMLKLIPLFMTDGRLIDYNGDEPLILGVKDFVAHFENQFDQGLILELEDKEVSSKTEIFGKIAHRTSLYEARFKSSDPEPFAAGVNSIQMIKLNGNWKVSSMAWNDDKDFNFFGASTKK